MNVLLLLSSGEIGGAERSLTRMAMAARSSGGVVRYQVASVGGAGAWCAWAAKAGLSPLVFGGKGNGSGVAAMWRAGAYARKNRFDAVYVVGLRASMCFRWLRRLFPKTKIVHGVRSNPASAAIFDFLFRTAERLCHRGVDLYVANSAAAAATLARCGVPDGKIRVVYNGLPGGGADPEPWIRRPKVMTVIANLQARKGLIGLIPALERLRELHPEWSCAIVGRDDARGRVQREYARCGLSGMVRFAGFQPDVFGWLRRSRLLLFPSTGGEGAPTSILESMQCGVPVVAYAVDGVPELFTDGVEGLLVPGIGDAGAFAAAADSVMSNPDMAAGMGLAGMRRVRDDFSLEKCVLEHERLFLDIRNE